MHAKSEFIFRHLVTLLRSNIYASTVEIANQALRNRFVGFRSELEFQRMVSHPERFYQGGFFIPMRKSSYSISCPVYITVGFNSPDIYHNIYSIFRKCSFSRLLYIQAANTPVGTWHLEDITGTDNPVPIPDFNVYDFQEKGFVPVAGNILEHLFTRKTNYKPSLVQTDQKDIQWCNSLMDKYTTNEVAQIYITRVFLDGFLGRNVYKGIPGDIDFVYAYGDSYKLIEVKEKDLSKTAPIGFGVDTRRLTEMLQIRKQTGLDYYYVIRHVDNQQTRNFIEWKCIEWCEFNSHADKTKIKNGGTGMSTAGFDHPTVLCLYDRFKEFSEDIFTTTLSSS